MDGHATSLARGNDFDMLEQDVPAAASNFV